MSYVDQLGDRELAIFPDGPSKHVKDDHCEYPTAWTKAECKYVF